MSKQLLPKKMPLDFRNVCVLLPDREQLSLSVGVSVSKLVSDTMNNTDRYLCCLESVGNILKVLRICKLKTKACKLKNKFLLKMDPY